MRSVAAALSCMLLVGVALAPATGSAAPARRNIVLFVADGLRASSVDAASAPDLAAVRAEGVDFADSHSLFPTITTPNASAIATGHRLGDTGDFGNELYLGAGLSPSLASPVEPLENDRVLGALNARHGGDYLNEISLAQAARARGYRTAVLGKLGPALIQDVRAGSADPAAVVIDDGTGHPEAGGPALPADLAAAIRAAGLSPVAPGRGANEAAGRLGVAGTKVSNAAQQAWFADLATKVLLPRFKADGRPFLLIFWSRDPDGTQHGQGDSPGTLVPGINGPTSLAGVRDASDCLGRLRAALKALGLEADTDVFVTADHGFSVESRQSATSAAARLRFEDTAPGSLPPGFLAIDLAGALGLPLFDTRGAPIRPAEGRHPGAGALIGPDAAHPDVVVAANGGADLIYLTAPSHALAARVVAALTAEDYAGGVFVDPSLGPIPGALSLADIGLTGTAVTPRPQIVVAFRSFGAGCARPETCGAEIGDTALQQGQGIHGSFGRQDTHNFMAAVGPDFRARFRDAAPVSNADIAPTLAHLIGADLGGPRAGRGRVIAEALAGGPPAPAAHRRTLRSAPAASGFVTVLEGESLDGEAYVDAAGMPGRTIGLP